MSIFLSVRGLSELMTAILGGLMENDLNSIMEFDDFFREIEKVHRKKVSYVMEEG